MQIEDGNEAAFEAAAGEALSAVLMKDETAARDGLAHLAGQRASGAVMPLEMASRAPGGQSRRHDQDLSLPDGAAWLRQYVQSSYAPVAALLDRLLAGAVVVEGGWHAAVELAAQRPELLVVSREGDRCAAGIWRTGLHSSGVTGAALEEARAALHDAAAASEQAQAHELQVRSGLDEARVTSSDAQKSVTARAATVRAANESLDRASSDLDETGVEAEELSSQMARLRANRVRDLERLAELEELQPGLEAAAAEAAQRALSERAARERLVERTSAVATLRRDFEVRASAIEERRALLGRRLNEVEQRLARTVAEREQATERRVRLDAMAKCRRSAGIVRKCEVDHARNHARGRCASCAKPRRALTGWPAKTSNGYAESVPASNVNWLRVREEISRNELESAQSKARLEALTETVRRELDCEPEALEGAECPRPATRDERPGSRPGARTGAATYGPGQPPGAGGARRARRTSPVPGGPAARRFSGPTRALESD